MKIHILFEEYHKTSRCFGTKILINIFIYITIYLTMINSSLILKERNQTNFS